MPRKIRICEFPSCKNIVSFGVLCEIHSNPNIFKPKRTGPQLYDGVTGEHYGNRIFAKKKVKLSGRDARIEYRICDRCGENFKTDRWRKTSKCLICREYLRWKKARRKRHPLKNIGLGAKSIPQKP